MSLSNKNLAMLDVPRKKKIEAFIKEGNVELAAVKTTAPPGLEVSETPEVAPESGVTPTPPVVLVADATVTVEVAKMAYKQTASLYTPKNGETKKRRSVYFPLDLERELAAFCAMNGQKVSDVIAKFTREGLLKHAR